MTDRTETAGADAEMLTFVEEQHAEIGRLRTALGLDRLHERLGTTLDSVIERIVARQENLAATVAEAVYLLRAAGVLHGEGLVARVRNLITERDQLRERRNGLTEALCQSSQNTERAVIERDQLQARIDEVVRRWPYRIQLGVLLGSQEAADEHLAALQGDQPAEPDRQPDARTARSGPTPQGFPAESRSTVDSGEAATKIHDPRPRKGGVVADPNACGQCGIPEREHAMRVGSDGVHTWQEPTDAQRKARMLARREEVPGD